jgi:hypothetical protein
MPKARTVFDTLAALLGEQAFFAGDSLSLADLLVAPAISFFTATPRMGRTRHASCQPDRVASAHGGAAEHEGDDLGACRSDGEGRVTQKKRTPKCSSINSLTRSGTWSAAKWPTPGSGSKR